MELITESELLCAADNKSVIAKRLTEFHVSKASFIDGSVYDLIDIAASHNSILLYYYVFEEQTNCLINCSILSEALANDPVLGEYYEGEVFSDSFFNVLYNMTLPEDDPEKKSSYHLNNLKQYERDILIECQRFNETVDLEHLSFPIGLKAFVPINGFAIGIDIEQENSIYSPAYDAAVDIIASHAEEIEALIKEDRIKQEQGEAKLRIQLLKDNNFHNCKNKALRQKYASDLWTDNKWIRDLFSDAPENRRKYPERRYLELVELVYAEYRSDKSIVETLQEPEN
ncbi:MAG: hypothetical protein IKQ73_04265 [Oscillospiraceae bacterium]|nr:hypothetical protein [Oscillospiraceae bacterium]